MFERLSKHEFIIIFLASFVWRIYLLYVEFASSFLIPQKTSPLFNNPWTNFDGAHYLSIAKDGYLGSEQAFFPLFPFLIGIVSRNFDIPFDVVGLLLVNLSFAFMVTYFYMLLKLDYKKNVIFYSFAFFLFFPTSFFFGAIYTESLFLALLFSSIYYARRKKFILSAILAAFASAARLVGIFIPIFLFYEYFRSKEKNKLNLASIILIPPFGIASFMYYLYSKFGDPFLFISSVSSFGEQRDIGNLTLLPQVVWRYLKIFIISDKTFAYYLSVFEFTIFFLVLFLIYYAWRRKVRFSYIIFSLIVLILPTLTGSFSSVPRYALGAFAVFIALALIKNVKVKVMLLTIGFIIQFFLAVYFLQGYFVS